MEHPSTFLVFGHSIYWILLLNTDKICLANLLKFSFRILQIFLNLQLYHPSFGKLIKSMKFTCFPGFILHVSHFRIFFLSGRSWHFRINGFIFFFLLHFDLYKFWSMFKVIVERFNTDTIWKGCERPQFFQQFQNYSTFNLLLKYEKENTLHLAVKHNVAEELNLINQIIIATSLKELNAMNFHYYTNSRPRIYLTTGIGCHEFILQEKLHCLNWMQHRIEFIRI